MDLSLSTRLRHLLITSRWQRWLFPVGLYHSLHLYPCMAAGTWVDLDSTSAARSSAHGRSVGVVTLTWPNAEFKTSLRKR